MRPLITSDLLQRTALETPARREPVIQARVLTSTPSADTTARRYTLTLAVADQQLTVNSEQDFAPGTRLTMVLKPGPALTVIKADAQQHSGQPSQSTSVPPEQAIARLLASRLPLQPPASQPAQPTTATLTSPAYPISNQASSTIPSPITTTTNTSTNVIGVLMQLLQTPSSAQPKGNRPLPTPVSPSLTTPSNTPSNNGTTTPGLSQQTQALLQQWHNQLPQAGGRDAAAIKTAIQQSGVFHEAQLLAKLNAAVSSPGNSDNSGSGKMSGIAEQLWQRLAALSPARPQMPAATTTPEQTAPLPLSQPAKQPPQPLQQTLQQISQNYSQQMAAAVAHVSDRTPSLTNLKAVLAQSILDLEGNHSRTIPLSWTLASETPLSRPLKQLLAGIETRQLNMASEPRSLLQTLLLLKDGEALQQVRIDVQRQDGSPHSAEQRPPEPRSSEAASTNSPHSPPTHNSDDPNAQHQHSPPSAAAQRQPVWQLKLHFELEQFGPLDVEIQLGWPRLDITFWSSQQHTRHMLSAALQPLRQRLQALGAEVQQMEVRHGSLPVGQQNVITQRLVDLHT
ncbi:flagellar hook-length control protein FliK [Oceanobacter antarcticus]|uniref:Flagellar hook-length control protein FliK n=1 Tax=Oceanobacter antarcticus TaxID=3133425 RepID=A0ABW8NH17_9GAMM